MACFLVPAAEAVITKVIETVEEKREVSISTDDNDSEDRGIPMSRKLKWLTWMLVGGAILLMFEHVWHGEVVPYPPFLTAMSNPEDTSEMLHEMATVGVTMAVLVTAVWTGMCIAADSILKRSRRTAKEVENS